MPDRSSPPDLVALTMANGELETLTQFLEYYRTVLIRKTWGLDSAQLQTQVAASSLTIGALIKHMALVEDDWFQGDYLGRDLPEPWASAPFDDDRDWDLHSAADDSLEGLLDQFCTSCERSRRAIASATPDDICATPSQRTGEPINLRWVLVHIIEEYARHCGHADLIREAIDGQTGD